MNAHGLLAPDVYTRIEICRYHLLNLKYRVCSELPVVEMGSAAVISFLNQAPHNITTSLIDDVAVCNLVFSTQECFQCVASPACDCMQYLKDAPIQYTIEQAIDEQQEKPVDDNTGVNDGHVSDAGTSPLVKPIPENQPVPPSATEDEKRQVEPSIQVGGETKKAQSMRIVLGASCAGQSPIVFEPNNTRLVSHPNMAIIGTMGTGKTQLARSVVAQFSRETEHNVGGRPVGMLVFDYKGDYKDSLFTSSVGGVTYKTNLPFNPLKLVVTEDVMDVNLPAITADRISDSLAKAYGLGLKQQSSIKQVIMDTYEDAGITRDSKTWGNPPPTMDDVIAKYIEEYDAKDKAYALFDKLRDYNIFTSSSDDCVSLFEWLDCVRVIDLTIYPDDTKRVIVSLILDLFYAEMRQLGASQQQDGYRELRAMILVDEAHQFLKKDFNSLRNIISEGRMFGVGMILSTQNVSDFHTAKEDYTHFILSWVIHHVNSVTKSDMYSIFGNSDPHIDKYLNFINKAELFQSVCKIGNLVEGIRDTPFFELINQDARFFKESELE